MATSRPTILWSQNNTDPPDPAVIEELNVELPKKPDSSLDTNVTIDSRGSCSDQVLRAKKAEEDNSDANANSTEKRNEKSQEKSECLSGRKLREFEAKQIAEKQRLKNMSGVEFFRQQQE